MKRNSNLGRALSVGLAGVTAISSIPVNPGYVYALESKDVISGNTASSVVERDGVNTNFLLSGSDVRWYIDSGTVFFKKDTVVEFSAPEESAVVGVKIVFPDGDNVIGNEKSVSAAIQDIINVDAKVVYSTGESEFLVPVEEYLSLAFSGAVAYGVDDVAPSISSPVRYDGLADGSDAPNTVNGYSKGGIIRLEYDLPLGAGEYYTVTIGSKTVGDNACVYDKDTSKLTIYVSLNDYSGMGGGSLEVNVTVYDVLGNASSDVTSLDIDYSGPVIEASPSIEGGRVVNGVLYFDGSESSSVDVNYSIMDAESGVLKAELLKDGQAVSEITEYSGVLNISEGGKYTIRAYDSLNNVSEKVLFEGNSIGFDVSRPDMTVLLNGVKLEEYTGWINGSNPLDLSISVRDDTYLGDVNYKINGIQEGTNVGINTFNKNIDLTSYLTDSDDFPVEVEAFDTVGSSKIVGHLKVDKTAPEIKDLGITGKYGFSGSTLYIGDDAYIAGTAEDNLSGIKSLEIYKDGVVVGTELPFKLVNGSKYEIKVADNAGNEKSYTLGDILGVSSDVTVSEDTDTPVINRVSGFDGYEVIDDVKWFKDKTELVFSVSDSNIKNVTISINGSVVVSGISKDGLYRIPFSKDGNYRVAVTAEDYIGHTSSDEFSCSVDYSSPVVEGVKISESVYQDAYGVYYKENPSISITGTDKIGVEAYYLCDADGVELETNTTGVFELGSGEYFIKAKDRLGHETGLIPVSELFNLDSNKIVVDSVKPVIECSRPSGDLDGWYSGHIEFKATVSDEGGIAEAKISINDSVLDTLLVDENVLTGSLKAGTNSAVVAEDGSYTVVVEVTDKAGNSSSWSDKVYIDVESPVLAEKKLNGEYVEKSHGIYFKENPTVTFKASDSGKGTVIYILQQNSFDKSENTDGVFTLTGGNYSFRLEDWVGNSTYLGTLKELFGLKSNNLVVDSDAPIIDCSRPSGDSDGWYGNHVEFSADINDIGGISSAVMYINGVEVSRLDIADFDSNVAISGRTDYAGVEAIDGYKYNITIEVEDNVGNTNSWSDTVYVDTEAPEISECSINCDYVAKDYGTFFREVPTFSVVASDTGIGIKEYILTNSKGNKVRSDNGSFVLGNDSYTIEVVDSLGNTTGALKLGDLLDFPSNDMFIDTETPIILCSRPEGDVDGWYNEDVEFPVAIHDSMGISSAVMTINGVEVDSFEANALTKKVNLSGRTSTVDPIDDFKYEVSIKVVDNSGRESVWSDTVYVDKEPPVLDKDSCSIGGTYSARDFGTFFSSNPVLTLKAKDRGIGVGEYILVDAEGNEISSKNGILVLSAGEYSVKIKDKVGNVTEVGMLKDILGFNSNIIYVDSSKPVILCSRPEGDLEGWYGDGVEFAARITDETGVYKATLSINGVVLDSFEANDISREVSLSGLTSDVEPIDGYSYKVAISVIDDAGRKSEWGDTVYVDKEAPSLDLENSKLIGNRGIKSYGTFFSETPSIELSGKDSGVGVSEYILIDSNGNETSSEEGIFDLEEGEYSVKVKDKLGNTSQEMSLKDMFGLTSNTLYIDYDDPVIDCSRPKGDLKGWYGKNVKYEARISDNIGIAKATMYVNGVEADSFDATGLEREVSLSASTESFDAVDGYKYTIKIVTEDNSGRRSEWSDTVYVDMEPPVLDTEKSKLEGNKVVKHYGVFFSETPKLTLVANDDGVGVRDYVVIDKDDRRAANSNGVFFLDESEYFVKVVDKLGNTLNAGSLKDIFKLESNMIYVDTEDPVINCTRPAGDLEGWYKDNVEFAAEISDNIGIGSASLKINGIELDRFEADGLEKSFTLKANTSSVNPVEGYRYDVEISVTDNSGRVSKWSDTVYVDAVSPVLNRELSKVNGVYDTKSYGTFFQYAPSISLVGEDDGIGVDKYILRDDEGNVVEKEDGVFTLSDGEYAVKITDKLGNTSEFQTLKGVFGFNSNTIYIDNAEPVIKYTRPSGGLNGWYAGPLNFSVELSDDLGIAKGKVYVNGVEVDSFTASDIVYGVELTVKTLGIAPKNDYSYDILVVARDNSGKTVEYKDILYVDMDVPVLNNSIIKTPYVNDTNGLFFKESPEIVFQGSDKGVGLESYILVDAYGNISENKTGVFKVSSGEYTLKLKDKLGNISTVGTLKNIFGLKSNKIVVDGAKPTISCEMPGGMIDGWYNRHVNLDAVIKDTVGISRASISINGKELNKYSYDGKTLTKEVKLSANTSSVADNNTYKYVVSVSVTDMSGNTSSWSQEVLVDRFAPSLKGKVLDGTYNQNGLGVFFKEEPTITLFAEDFGSGFDKYILVGLDRVESKTGKFKLGTGSYSVDLMDKIGNINRVGTLKDIFGLSSNNFYVDGERPTIKCSRPSGDVNGWFARDVEYVADIGDNLGIEYAEIVINGKVISTFEGKSLIKSTVLKADTSKADIAQDGSYDVKIRVRDFAGNTTEWSDFIRKDTTAPVIEKFTITSVGYKEGRIIDGTKNYGFYFDGAAEVEISVSDGDISSGLDSVHYSLIDVRGKTLGKEGTAKIVNGVATVLLPEDFKGYINAYAEDNVGNIGKVDKPDGIITETSNVHVNSSSIDITIPDTTHEDSRGVNLYNNTVNVLTSVMNKMSGIRSVEWGAGSETRGTLEVDNNGNLYGNMAYEVSSTEENLAIGLTSDVAVGDNTNSVNVWFKVSDRVGHVSEKSRTVSIDKDAPVISVTYDSTEESGFYNKTRTATITIDERNFRAEDVKINGTYGTVGNWSYNNGVWSCPVVFSEDGVYSWSVEYTDMAGNVGKGYSSESFTIDKTAPQLTVVYDNDKSENTNFYKKGRTASIIVVEKNFDPNLVVYEGTVGMGSWSHDGDTYTCSVAFTEDGEHEFKVSLKDRSGNASTEYSSGKFIIDKTAPSVNISGVQDDVSYKKNIGFTIDIKDTNIDTSRSSVSLTGRANGEIALTGGFADTSGIFTFSGVPEDKAYDDLYTLAVTVYDKAGNVSKKEIIFSINRYGSAYEFINEHMLNNIISSAKDAIVQETSVDRLDTDSSKVVVIRDGEVIDVNPRYIKVEESGGVDGAWVYTYRVNKKAFDTDGKYQIQVYSKSYDGSNNSSLTEEFAFMLDTTPPEVIISGIESGQFISGVLVKTAIEARDMSGIASIVGVLNGNEVELEQGEDGIYYMTINESTKKQNLEVKAVDFAGHETTVTIEDFMVTSSVIQSLFNTVWAKIGIGALATALLAVILLLIRKVKKSRDAERKTAAETAQMYKDSTTGGSSGASSTSGRTGGTTGTVEKSTKGSSDQKGNSGKGGKSGKKRKK